MSVNLVRKDALKVIEDGTKRALSGGQFDVNLGDFTEPDVDALDVIDVQLAIT